MEFWDCSSLRLVRVGRSDHYAGPLMSVLISAKGPDPDTIGMSEFCYEQLYVVTLKYFANFSG